MKKILNEQIEKIRPSEKEIEELENSANSLIKKLNSKGLKAFIGGSLAKGTVIRKEIFPEGMTSSRPQDVDIFVVFDYSEDILRLEKVLSSLKLKGLKKVHGSRDYFQLDLENCVLEIIPVVRTEDPELAENVTDMSLSHVKYVRKEIEKNPRIADEIRLAKAFCKAARIYGAESYTKGFSGYSLEVLVVYFGGFVQFLKGVQKKKIIDPKKLFKNDAEVRREINSSKLQSPVILVDPTFKYRNVTAGLGFETFGRFVEIAKEFLKKPSSEFFILKEFNAGELRKFAEKNKALLVEVKLSTDRQEGDIAGTKMKKFLDFFARELFRKQQKVLRKEFLYSGEGNEALGYLVVKEIKEIEVQGPRITMKEAVEKFKKAKDGKYFERKKYLWTKEGVSVKSIFKQVRKVESEMGAKGEIKIL